MLMLTLPMPRKPSWDQAAIDRALVNYRTTAHGRDVVCEQLWWLIRDEVMLNLKAELKDEMAADEAEFIALLNLRHRLEKGSIKSLSKAYIRRFVCKTATRFIWKHRPIFVDFEAENSPAGNISDSRFDPSVQESMRYADLYYCFEKLNPNEKQLLQVHHYQDMKLEDVAKELGIDHAAARKRHSRALEKLRDCLKKTSTGGWS
jgi:RNA polymerase sigma factor (sigma-70 family)